jgi:hypothetical protein
MYNNPYMMNYNPNIGQISLNEKIDNEIAKLQQMKEQMKNNNNQQPAINQTFQLAPNNSHTMRYANTIEDVERESVYFDTPFFSKDMSVVWVKGAKGDIKTYELTEIIQKDNKDIQIEMLQAQINEMKGMIENAKSNDEPINESIESKESTNVSIPRTSTKKSKESTRDI